MNADFSTQRASQPRRSHLLSKLLDESTPAEDGADTQACVGALLQDASDVHFSAVTGGHPLRSRMDGAMIDAGLLDKELSEYVIRSFMCHADLDPAFTLRPQEGRRLEDWGTSCRAVAGIPHKPQPRHLLRGGENPPTSTNPRLR